MFNQPNENNSDRYLYCLINETYGMEIIKKLKNKIKLLEFQRNVLVIFVCLRIENRIEI